MSTVLFVSGYSCIRVFGLCTTEVATFIRSAFLLHLAVQLHQQPGGTELVGVLLALGADSNSKDAEGDTPLVGSNSKDAEGDTPLVGSNSKDAEGDTPVVRCSCRDKTVVRCCRDTLLVGSTVLTNRVGFLSKNFLRVVLVVVEHIAIDVYDSSMVEWQFSRMFSISHLCCYII